MEVGNLQWKSDQNIPKTWRKQCHWGETAWQPSGLPFIRQIFLWKCRILVTWPWKIQIFGGKYQQKGWICHGYVSGTGSCKLCYYIFPSILPGILAKSHSCAVGMEDFCCVLSLCESFLLYLNVSTWVICGGWRDMGPWRHRNSSDCVRVHRCAATTQPVLALAWREASNFISSKYLKVYYIIANLSQCHLHLTSNPDSWDFSVCFLTFTDLSSLICFPYKSSQELSLHPNFDAKHGQLKNETGRKNHHRKSHNESSFWDVEPTHLKNMRKSNGANFPQGSGWTFQKYLSCHHLVIFLLPIPQHVWSSKNMGFLHTELWCAKQNTNHTPVPVFGHSCALWLSELPDGESRSYRSMAPQQKLFNGSFWFW